MQCHGNRRGSLSISGKRPLQGRGVEQEWEAPGHLSCWEGGLDLSQRRTNSVNFTGVRRRGGG